jgi:hypothetical protein
LHHRHTDSPDPRRLRIVAGLLGLGLVLGLGVGMTAWAGRSEPRAAENRFDEPATPPVFQPRVTPPTGAPTAPTPSAGPITPSLSAPTAAPTTTPARPPAAPTPSKTTAPPPPGGVRTIQAYITGYSYFDNTPPGSVEISNPVLHQTAGGTGTYADPITVAVGHSIVSGRDRLDWPAGTRFYIPNLRRYFIVEDTCGDGSSPQNGPCHVGYTAPATTWLDLWVGGMGGLAGGADSCMNSITAVWDVLVNPGFGYATVPGAIDGAAGCTKQYGNAVVTG